MDKIDSHDPQNGRKQIACVRVRVKTENAISA